MTYRLSEEQREFRDTLRRFFDEHSPAAEVRRLMETEAGYDERVWQRMAEELGLQSVAIPERRGGQGLGLHSEPFEATCKKTEDHHAGPQ